MSYQLYELSGGSDVCQEKRLFNYETQGKTVDNMKTTGIARKAIHRLVSGGGEESVKEEMQKDYDDIDFLLPKQRKLNFDLAWKEVLRYSRSEKEFSRKLIDLSGRNTEVDVQGISVLVNPDYLVIGDPVYDRMGIRLYDTTLEVFKIHASRPKATQSGVRSNLELYALLKFLRLLVKPGKKAYLKASVYYLKKNNDRGENTQSPHFDWDFFDTKGAGNIITLSEEYVGGDVWNETDERFQKTVDQFLSGIPKEECDKDDCEICDLFDICHYQEPPLRLEEKPSAFSLASLRLTKAQEEAIEFEERVARINAGAGSGKTQVLSMRTVTLANKGYDPKKIACITLTNSGVEAMKERNLAVADDYGTEGIEDVFVSTFHSFGYSILKKEYSHFLFTEEPELLDPNEQGVILAKLLEKHDDIPGIDYKNVVLESAQCKGAVPMAKKVFQYIKLYGYGLNNAEELYERLEGDRRFCSLEGVKGLIKLYDEYDLILRENNFVDYADMETMIFELLKDDPYYFEQFGFEHVMIDEFQDSSEAQIAVIKKLKEAPSCQSLMVIGDDAQSIMGFRETTPEYIINFEKYIGCEVTDIQLVENFRCTPEIIDAANKVIAKNKHRLVKNLIATRPSGMPVVVRGFHNKKEEQEYVIAGVKRKLKDGVKPEDIAIICATKYELMAMSDLLKKEGIPSVLMNPENYIDNSRVRASVALMNYLNDNNDTKDLLTYVNAKIGGGILEKTHEEIDDLLNAEKKELEKINDLSGDDRKDAIMEAMKAIDLNDDEVFQNFLNTLSLKPSVERMESYVSNLYTFGKSAAYRRQHDYPGLVLTTAHSSKGLEWKVVFAMISKFHTEELDVGRDIVGKQEERRRLLFVTMTRARDELYVTSQYIAYGKQGCYTFNRFLEECYEVTGEVLNESQVLEEKAKIALAEKEARAEAKRKAIAEAKKTDYND